MPIKIREGKVVSDDIESGAVGSAKLSSDSVYGVKIANDAIGSEHIGANAISYSAQIKDGIIANDDLAGNITSNKIPALLGTAMPKTGGTFVGSVEFSGDGKPPRLAVLTPGGAIVPVTLGAVGTAVHGNFSYYEQRFTPGTSNYAYWEFQIPEYYDAGTLDFDIFWKGHPATGTVVWKALTLGRTINETWDSATSALGSKCTNTQGSAKVTKSTITGKPDFVADELAVVKLYRDGANAKDTLAGSVSLLMMSIDYKAVK